MSKVFPLSFRRHTKKLNCLFTASLNSMHGRKASPTTNPGKSNTTKVCYEPLCGSIKLHVSSPFIALGQRHGIIVGYLADNLVLLVFGAFQVWEPAHLRKPRNTSLICRDTVSLLNMQDLKMMKLSPLYEHFASSSTCII